MRIERDGVPMVASPMRIDGHRPVADAPPPRLDEHGDAIRAALKAGQGWPR
jgi:crotonobetainyl-CoA:carnitine CoA-transferase CaiB-like acyl-CoA transferase